MDSADEAHLVDEDSSAAETREEAEADEAGQATEAASETTYPMYIVPADEKTKTQVVIYHDDSIRSVPPSVAIIWECRVSLYAGASIIC